MSTMEVVKGKHKDKKIVIAQEIAFAKVLAGNNKTLRDRAVKKLRKWLTLRGTGKWAFTEDEFLRIWTGLFYCMWMSDKFLVQEELAESISSLVHCFKKSSESALLFIECFNKRILMDWEGLDQYRIDKFNMLVRRFLRQTLFYCKEKDWEESFLHKLTDIFYNIVLHRNNSLGFVMHFISIFAEELAKVSKGKLETKTVLTFVEPFIKLLSRTDDGRIQREVEDFFTHLMRQTDIGIEYEEKFNAWKEQGFPGEGPHCMENVDDLNDDEGPMENGTDSFSEDEEILENDEEPLDPRAGSVHVVLPQIPIDLDEFIKMFQKYQNSKGINVKGRRILKKLRDKFAALKRGQFPEKITKDPILDNTKRDKKLTKKNAMKLLKFTRQLDEDPIKTEEFQEMSRQLEEQDDDEEDQNCDEELESDTEIENADDYENDSFSDFEDEIQKVKKSKIKNKAKQLSKKQKIEKINNLGKDMEKSSKKSEKVLNALGTKKIKENINHKENLEQQKKKKKRKNRKRKEKNSEHIIADEEIIVKPKKKQKVNGVMTDALENLNGSSSKVTPITKAGTKRKILSSWQVQELDTSSPEYYKLETPKVIRIEKKINDGCCSCDDNETEEGVVESEWKSEETPKEEIFPVFWEKARQKAGKKSGSKGKVFMNPFANIQTESKSPGRRISFALDKNMAQENEQYLEEVKNSPRVPFDGSKKPVQSALKSGLAPSPVNPFYRYKKIKF